MSKSKSTSTTLPVSRITKIMMAVPGVSSVSPDVIALTTKATELFIQGLGRNAYDSTPEDQRTNRLDYDNIADLVQSDMKYEFLSDSCPKKVKYSEALEAIAQSKAAALKAAAPTPTTPATAVPTEPESTILNKIDPESADTNETDLRDDQSGDIPPKTEIST